MSEEIRNIKELLKNPVFKKFFDELRNKHAKSIKDLVEIIPSIETLKLHHEIVLSSEENIDKYFSALKFYFPERIKRYFFNKYQIFIDFDNRSKWHDFVDINTLLKVYELNYIQSITKEGKTIKDSFEEFFTESIVLLLKNTHTHGIRELEDTPIVIKFKNKLYGDVNTWKIMKVESEDDSLTYYVKLDDNNLIYMNITGTQKKKNIVTPVNMDIPIFQLHKCEKIYDPIDNKTVFYISGWKLQGNEEKYVEIIDINDIGQLLSSPIINLCKKYKELYMELKNVLKQIISQKAEDCIKTEGFAVITHNGHLTIPKRYKMPDTIFCEDLEHLDRILTKDTDELIKEDLIKYLALFNKVHNLTTIGAFIASHLIHVIKPKIVSPVFIWGDSGVGKTSIAMLLSYVNPASSQTTSHQLMQKISGFRCGIVYFDEKIEYSSQLTQDLKYSATNCGYIHRISHNKKYVANVMFLATSNPQPKFKTRGLEDLKGLLRRAVFLKVIKELDEIKDEKIDEAYEILDIYRNDLIKILLDELTSFSEKEIKDIYRQFTVREKYKLLLTGIELWKAICEKYNIKLNINYDELIRRFEDSEKEILGFGDISLLELIKGRIIEDAIHTARVLDVEGKDIVVRVADKNVVKSLLTSKGYAIYLKDKKLYAILSVRGFKNLKDKIKELPDLETKRDIESYLGQNGIEFEYKNTRAYGISIKGFFIEIKDIEIDIEDDEENNISNSILKSRQKQKNLEEKIIKTIEEAGEISFDELKEKIGLDEETLEKLIKRLIKLGDILEVRPNTYKILV
ncbi:Sigma 54 interacting domain protein [Methanocaldococcus vulcanius M7]|uniref:Sigma 54 interacting domain protein n=1 Tax=Methanocaldococcus vulcanius (strain ATCC 700851 / DSM 12094 / M7) TaxID=579137 RepID=C9RFV5_METVM|nr:RNA polymerase subunit sigma-54 [Methanocaldococcus vulcanius]ACX72457.1 Sigma 54 interacting domain protein [Methanocaldococcus vulcanius M7]